MYGKSKATPPHHFFILTGVYRSKEEWKFKMRTPTFASPHVNPIPYVPVYRASTLMVVSTRNYFVKWTELVHA